MIKYRIKIVVINDALRCSIDLLGLALDLTRSDMVNFKHQLRQLRRAKFYKLLEGRDDIFVSCT